MLQVPCATVNADNRSDPRGTPRPILGPPLAQKDCLLDGDLVERQLHLSDTLDVRSPELLRLVDSVQRGPFRAVVLEGVDMSVKVGHGLQFYWTRAGKATQGRGRVHMLR